MLYLQRTVSAAYTNMSWKRGVATCRRAHSHAKNETAAWNPPIGYFENPINRNRVFEMAYFQY